jgi:REP element-mobilizing transposase RayT
MRNVRKTNEPRRRSARLRGFDYSQPGAYFVTVCVKGKRCVLGDVEGERICLTGIGSEIKECWLSLEKLYKYIELDEWKIMPNHIHGILIIHDPSRGEAFEGKRLRIDPYLPSNASPVRVPRGTKPGSLGAVVQNFKSISTRKINQLTDTPGKSFWQRGYYDRIIRNREELNRIRKYISENLLKWELDEYHPSSTKKR